MFSPRLLKLIDTRTGKPVEVGKPVVYDSGVTYIVDRIDKDELTVKRHEEDEPGWYRVLKVQDEVFSARALVEGNKLKPSPQWVPLRVRITHPNFLFRRVAFVPT